MIGQVKLKTYLTGLILKNRFPSFSIFVGFEGSGKKTLVRELFKDAIFVPDNKVDTIRGLIDTAENTFNKTYVFADADNMSLTAKNALLKLVEECRNGNRFIMTLTDTDNTLPTIKSRGVVFFMDYYTPKEILEYAQSDSKIIRDTCRVPGDVDKLRRYGIDEFYDYVKLVADNIAEVSGANALKIGNKIALKAEDTDKYDLKLFWYTFLEIRSHAIDNCSKCYRDMIITSEALRDLVSVNGINKQSLFDMWVLNIRENWLSDDTGITE